MSKKVSKTDEATEVLMDMIKSEQERFNGTDDSKERKDAAENVSVMADKIGRLEDVANSKKSGIKDRIIQGVRITVDVVLGGLGLYFTQKNLHYIDEHEEEHVVRGEAEKYVVKESLNAGDNYATRLYKKVRGK